MAQWDWGRKWCKSRFLIRTPFLPPFQNGFLKRLPHNERKSSALSKLLKSDRFWAVFSVHDEVHPFLELWNEPTEVAGKPPQYVFPLAVCQHIRSVIQHQCFVSGFDFSV